MNKLVIFGNSTIAELAHYYFTEESEYEIVGFTADRDFVTEPTLFGLPVVPFDEVTQKWDPKTHKMFVALSYAKLNRLREEKFKAAQNLGYDLVSFVSKDASCAKNAKIGKNCFILENVVVQPFVEIGDNVTIWSGTHVGHHVKVQDHCFITSQVVISGGVNVGKNSFLGVNATIRDHIDIADFSLIGAGTLILQTTEPESLYIGTASTPSRVPSTKVRSM